MSVTSRLAVDLSLLTDALAEPAADLSLELQLLAGSARRAVASCDGLAVTVDVGTRPMQLLLTDPDATVPCHASLHFRVPDAAGLPGPVALTLFATVAGAFVDLGADLTFLFDLAPAHIVLDRHLDPAAGMGAISVGELTTVNRAVGVLVARGDDLESARATLDRTAAADHRSVVAVATTVLASASLRPVVTPAAATVAQGGNRPSDPGSR